MILSDRYRIIMISQYKLQENGHQKSEAQGKFKRSRTNAVKDNP